MTVESNNRVSSICAECGAPIAFELGSMQVQCDHCEAGLVVDQGQRLVRLACPACGGNFYYIDGSMCGSCPYCEASLLALSRDRLLRYVFRPRTECPEAAQGAALELLPFWHLAGLLFGWDVGSRVTFEEEAVQYNSEGQPNAPPVPMRKDSGPMRRVRNRVVDVSQPDPAVRALGICSLRMRAGVFPMEPFCAEHKELGRVVPPSVDATEIRGRLRGRAMSKSSPTEGMTRLSAQRKDLVAEELALYYYPFWVKRAGDEVAAWDAMSGEPEPLAAPQEAPRSVASTAFDQLKLIELSCGECGEALPAGNHSMVLPCTACGQFWRVAREGLEPFSARYARPQAEAQEPVWLPFWRVPCTLVYGGRKVRRAGDVRNVLGVITPPGELPRAPAGAPLCYYVSAYGNMRAPRVDHAARDMTRVQPALKPGPAGEGDLYHCFYGAQDARQLSYITWINIMPGVVPHRLRSLRVQPGEPELWYVPFDSRGRELVSLVTGLRYDKSAFRGVRH